MKRELPRISFHLPFFDDWRSSPSFALRVESFVLSIDATLGLLDSIPEMEEKRKKAVSFMHLLLPGIGPNG